MRITKNKFKYHRFTRAFSSALLLVIAGCSAQKAYDGTFDPSQTSRIVSHGVTLIEVNGHIIGMNAPEVEVLAGPVNARLKVDRSNYNAPDAGTIYRLKFNAVAGQEYVVTGRLKICAFPRYPGSNKPDLNSPVGCIIKE